MSSDGMSDFIEAHVKSVMEEMVPHFDDAGFSQPHRAQVDTIHLLLHSLNSSISSLRADIELFDYAESHPEVMMRWSPIACRDAAMTIWNFMDALKHIQAALKRCPPLKTKKREYALRAVIGRSGATFPDAKKMRHVTAHPVGHVGTPQARKENALQGTPVIVHNSWAGRKVMHSALGREISFEMSDATVQTLRGLRNSAFAVFRDDDVPSSSTAGE